MAARFEIYRDEAGEFRWRLRAGNGEIVATSEAYGSRRDAERGAADATGTVAAAGGTEFAYVREAEG